MAAVVGASAGTSGEAYLAEASEVASEVASVAHLGEASAVDPSGEAYPHPAEGRYL